MSDALKSLKRVLLTDLVKNPKDDIVDGPFGSRLKASEYVDNGVPIVRLQNIDRNRFIDKNIKFVTPAKAKDISRHHFMAGDILVSKLGDPLGEACIAPDHLAYGILVADVVRVRPNNAKVDTVYLSYALNSATVAAQFTAETKGTTRPRVNLKKIRDLEIPVAESLPEQRRIVAEIEKQFTRLEAGVAALQRVQANLKRYRAAVLKAACEGRLVPTEAELARQCANRHPGGVQDISRGLSASDTPGHGSQEFIHPEGVAENAAGSGIPSGCEDSLTDVPGVSSRPALLNPRLISASPPGFSDAGYETGAALLARILTERRQNWQGHGQYKEPATPETAKLPELPAGWAWATVEQLAAPEPNSITDGPFGSNLKTEHYMDSGPRVIRLQNIGDGVYVDEEAHISQAHFERLQKHRIFANDVVIAGFGENPPRSCIIPEALGPAIVKADCIRFKPHSSVTPKYMNVSLNSDPVRKRTKGMVHGVGRPRLNLGEIKSIVLPLPPLAEQTRIVAEVERRLSVVEELEAVVSANLQRATRLRQSILQKAFTGELV